MESIDKSFSREFQLEYQEELLMSYSSKQQLTIGVPKEDLRNERRVALTPYTVKLLVENGMSVLVEAGAGEASNYTDVEYSESGAEIVEQTKLIFKADVVVKIAPPNAKQIDFLRKNQVLISSLNIKTLERQFFQQLAHKKVTAIAFEYIKDEQGDSPFVQLMSEITGRVAINVASDFLKDKKGKLLGRIAGNIPSEIIVIGTGAVAKSAVDSAIKIGALVKVFDNSISKLKAFERYFSMPIYTSILYPEILKQEFPRADVVIGALSSDGVSTPVISKELVQMMKKDAIVIDLTIDQGACFETSKLTNFNKPTFLVKGVTHYGVPNIPSTVPRTASNVLSNIFLQQFSKFQNYGSMNQFLKNDSNFRNGLYFYKGVLVNKRIGTIFDLPYQDINLILAAF